MINKKIYLTKNKHVWLYVGTSMHIKYKKNEKLMFQEFASIMIQLDMKPYYLKTIDKYFHWLLEVKEQYLGQKYTQLWSFMNYRVNTSSRR